MELVDGVVDDAGHGGEFFADLIAVDDEEGIDEVIDGEHGLADEGAEVGRAAEAARTDEDGVVTANNRNGTNTTSVVFLQPRTYGLSVSKSF